MWENSYSDKEIKNVYKLVYSAEENIRVIGEKILMKAIPYTSYVLTVFIVIDLKVVAVQ